MASASRTSPSDLARLEQAYRVLGLPMDSSALRIKREYWRLARMWHPDRYAHDSAEQGRAAARMREINAAYELIKHAPLRFRTADAHAARAERTVDSAANRGAPVVSDVAEYVIRFVAGCGAGLFLSWLLALEDAPVALLIVVPVLMGAASVIFGDRFWSVVLRILELWP